MKWLVCLAAYSLATKLPLLENTRVKLHCGNVGGRMEWKRGNSSLYIYNAELGNSTLKDSKYQGEKGYLIIPKMDESYDDMYLCECGEDGKVNTQTWNVTTVKVREAEEDLDSPALEWSAIGLLVCLILLVLLTVVVYFVRLRFLKIGV